MRCRVDRHCRFYAVGSENRVLGAARAARRLPTDTFHQYPIDDPIRTPRLSRAAFSTVSDAQFNPRRGGRRSDPGPRRRSVKRNVEAAEVLFGVPIHPGPGSRSMRRAEISSYAPAPAVFDMTDRPDRRDIGRQDPRGPRCRIVQPRKVRCTRRLPLIALHTS